MIAVVLSGGMSRRMGQDKGLMQTQGQAWAAKLQHTLAGLSLPVYISVNAQQQAAYRLQFSEQRLITDEGFAHLNGPLRGILSAHQAFPDEHILCVPCDMPLLTATVFTDWLHTFNRQYPACQLFISKTRQQLQPLCGIYSREGLQHLHQLYGQQQLHNLSMHAIVEQLLPSCIMPVADEQLPLFRNFNSPADLSNLSG